MHTDKGRFIALVALTAALLVPGALAAQGTLDADTIVEKANLAAYYAGADGRSEARMRIIDGQGREQRRQFTVLRRNVEEAGDQQFLVVFSQPSDVRGTTFLVHKHTAGDDDRWLYLPGLDLVKRIAAGDKRTSFVGSHYYYEDVSGRRPDEDTHELVGSEDGMFELVHRPRDPSSVEFAEYTTWIDQETFLPMKIEYRNSTGKPIRRVEVKNVETIQGNPTVTASRISDLESGGYTDMQFRYIAYDLGMPEDLFGERSLRSPASEWLQRPEGR
ncbi:MAG: outer membrane lipoprotein-sorting protein [Xanthomonadales bacterium]|jgi:outer membrane lipoprotein-sorting protein|nr:outer membrane lipoprotein-sorting protein [Xanthomonadales bacterium]